MIILDTNVLSELIKSSPDRGVEAWVVEQPWTSLFTTTITQAEILYGVALLPSGRRRDVLRQAVQGLFLEDFSGRLLPFDAAAARAYAEIAATRRKLGKPISQFDAQIAAIVQSRNACLATRNVTDFQDCAIRVLNPWEE